MSQSIAEYAEDAPGILQELIDKGGIPVDFNLMWFKQHGNEFQPGQELLKLHELKSKRHERKVLALFLLILLLGLVAVISYLLYNWWPMAFPVVAVVLTLVGLFLSGKMFKWKVGVTPQIKSQEKRIQEYIQWLEKLSEELGLRRIISLLFEKALAGELETTAESRMQWFAECELRAEQNLITLDRTDKRAILEAAKTAVQFEDSFKKSLKLFTETGLVKRSRGEYLKTVGDSLREEFAQQKQKK